MPRFVNRVKFHDGRLADEGLADCRLEDCCLEDGPGQVNPSLHPQSCFLVGLVLIGSVLELQTVRFGSGGVPARAGESHSCFSGDIRVVHPEPRHGDGGAGLQLCEVSRLHQEPSC